jgi:sugar/nucleoside kinase (ribokinase family)
MKKYKIYGIGNALLDYEYKVNDKILEELGLEKGCMLLNEYEKHFNIHSFLKNIRPPEKVVPGGSVANSVYAMSQFGSKVCFSGKVSNDKTGNDFIDCLIESGINTFVEQSNENQSGECLVLITPDNERTMNTFLGSSSLLGIEDIDVNSLISSEHLLVEGYLVSSEQTLEVSKFALEQAKKNDTKTILTLSDPNIVSFFRQNLLQLFKSKVNIVFCNEQEAKNFSETDSLKDTHKFLREMSDTYIITFGKDGAICFDGKNLLKVKGLEVSSKDFTGAGDMFLGAFMHKIKNNNFLEAMIFANYCASRIIQVYGAKFSNKNDYLSLIEKL